MSEQWTNRYENFPISALTNGFGHPEYKKADAQIAEIERQIRRPENIAQRVNIEYRESHSRVDAAQGSS